MRVYGEQRDLPFFLYERHLAKKFFAAHVRAQSKGVTGDVRVRDSQASGGFWEITQDVTFFIPGRSRPAPALKINIFPRDFLLKS